MISFQEVTLCGRLGKDPETRRFPNGGMVVSFSIATSESWKDKATGERKERTEWHNVSVQNENKAKFIAEYGHKGDMVLVKGQIRSRKYNDKEGIERVAYEIIVPMFGGEVQLHSDKKAGGRGGDGFDDDGGSSSRGGSSGGRSSGSKPSSYSDEIDDDIPF
jgi:single-strand DNA-binding protein